MSELKIVVMKKDLTQMKTGAVVNPANSLGQMGGGVAGAIRQQGGKVIEDEAKKRAPLELGEAALTTAGSLPAGYVIHAPTMRRPAERTTPEQVKKALAAALNAAEEKGLTSLAVPGMGTGAGRVPPEEAALAILETLNTFSPRSLTVVYLVDINDRMVEAFQKALAGELTAAAPAAPNPPEASSLSNQDS